MPLSESCDRQGGQCPPCSGFSGRECMTMQQGKNFTMGDFFLSSFAAWVVSWSVTWCSAVPAAAADIGREVAIPTHLQDGQEFQVSLRDLLAHGKHLFTANWTSQE